MRLLTGLAVVLTLTLTAFAAEAQQAGKLPRIGVLFLGSSSTQAVRAEIVRQELRRLGYIEGQTLTLEIRFANGHLDQVRALATELMGARVEVILTAGTAVVQEIKPKKFELPIKLRTAKALGVTIPPSVLGRAEQVIE